MPKSKDKKKKPPSPTYSIVPEVEIDEAKFRSIQIKIEKLINIEAKYEFTDVYVEVRHENELIGQTNSKLVTNRVSDINCELNWSIYLENEVTLDKLMANPLYFTVYQILGEPLDPSETAQLFPEPTISTESLFEPILGEIIVEEPVIEIELPKKGKGAKQSKDSKKDSEKDSKASNQQVKKGGSKISKQSETTVPVGKKGKKEKEVKIVQEPLLIGNANMDFLPLFLEKPCFQSVLPVYQDQIYMNSQMVTYLCLPRLTVSISTDQPFFEEEKEVKNIFAFTIEAMFNLPAEYEHMDFKVATVFPMASPGLTPVTFDNGRFKIDNEYWPKFKLWSSLSHKIDFSSRTTFRINESSDNIKNKCGVNLEYIFDPDTPLPRIEWNLQRKCFLTEDGTQFLKDTFIRYRLWPIEIKLSPKLQINDPKYSKKDKSKSSKSSKSSQDSKSSKSSKGSKGSKGSKKSKKIGVEEKPMHLMGFIDISSLLYPGEMKTRVVCELRSYQELEFIEKTGVPHSYFYIPPIPEEEKQDKKGKGKPGEKESKKGDKGKDSAKTKKGKKVGSVNEDVPVIPEPPPPSTSITNEAGDPTYIVIEVEVWNPLTSKRTLEDLTNELCEIIPQFKPLPKVINNVHLSVEMHKECLKKLTLEINEEYQKFYKALVTPKKGNVTYMDFVVYLKKCGMYHKLFSTMLESIANLVNEKYRFDGDTHNHKLYERYISDIYVKLVNEMNTEINSLISCSNQQCDQAPPILEKPQHYRCFEAIEMHAGDLAERYVLEALAKHANDAHFWYEYAIYHLTQNELNLAFECLKEALALQSDLKYGLILFGVILFELEEYYLSETAFLKVTVHHPEFLYGWTCLYVFYKEQCKWEGCDVCLEKIKSIDWSPDAFIDDILYNTDGLAWTTALSAKDCPFYETAMILIKLRALNFAEKTIICANAKEFGVLQYYHGVILYHMHDYEHAIIHLVEAQKLHGPDYAVNSLLGHCLFNLNFFEEAKEAYEFIVYAYNRPDDMHLVYLKLAHIHENENNLEMARKYLLLVVKYSPTPYSWLLLGIVYYKEKEILNAESCLIVSNLLDNRFSETWAYLTLVNIKKGAFWEAEQCYVQTKKLGLGNENLLAMVEDEMKRHCCCN